MQKLSVQKSMQKAKSLARKQQYGSAVELYMQLIEAYPQNKTVRNALVDMVNTKVLIHCSHPDQNTINQLLSLFNSRKFDVLLPHVVNLLRTFSQSYFLWNLKGITEKELGDLSAAKLSFEKALAIYNLYPEGNSNLGVTLFELGLYGESIKYYQRSLILKPNHEVTFNNMGNSYKEMGHFDDARSCFEKAIGINNQYADAYGNLSVLLISLKQFDDALNALNNCTRLAPENAIFRKAFGDYYKGIGDHDLAISEYRRALEINPSLKEALLEIANISQEKCDFGKAEKAYIELLKLFPNYLLALVNLANVYVSVGDREKAKPLLTNIIEASPDQNEAHFYLGQIELQEKNFQLGWQEYEYRWSTVHSDSKEYISSKPRWQGNEVDRLLIWCEQGVGDIVMFASAIKDINSYCNKLIIACPNKVINLFERSFPFAHFVDDNSSLSDTDFDEHISIGSALALLRPSIQSFEDSREAYLKPDAALSKMIRDRLLKDAPNKKLIGISWHSGNQKNGASRSIDIVDLAKSIPESYRLVNLQYGDVDEQIERVRKCLSRDIAKYDDINNFDNIDGFAALVSAMDSVVTIDNTTVHVAGALGVNTNLLLSYGHDWRWGSNDTTSYWYKNVSIYKQKKPGNWASALDKVVI